MTQALYALALYAETTSNAVRRGRSDQLDQRLDRIAAAARQALREMRLLLYELRPATQQTARVAETLLLRLDAVESRAGIAVHAEIDENLVLPTAWEADVYWIAIEALNNSLKHASAKRIHVQLAHAENSLVLTVEDDGSGFLPEQAGHAQSGGFGLRSMRDRASRLGGLLGHHAISFGRSSGVLAHSLGRRAGARADINLCGGSPVSTALPAPLRIVVVEDHPMVREAIVDALAAETDMQVVGQAADGKSAVAEALRLCPDVVIMDLFLPVQGGVEAILQIKAQSPGVKILALTSATDEALFLAALQAGANGYLVKDSERSALLSAVREVARGNTSISPRMVAKLVAHLSRQTGGQSDQLSDRERKSCA